MSFMLAFGWASIMLCIGVLLRAKVPFLRNMLVPASVIAGVIGIVFTNGMANLNINIGTDTAMFTEIVNYLFTISFISIGLTSAPKDNGNGAKQVFHGTLAMGLLWCLLYSLTPLIATGIVALLGKGVAMNAIYGMLIQFAFCQGPGQATSFGTIFEQYGWENAAMVGLAFAVLGFAAAFLVGIPAAKRGIKRGIAKNGGTLDETTLRGYLSREEQTEQHLKNTTCSSNIETLAFHFALIGICFVLAVGISKLFALVPSFIGSSMSGMMFMNGMIAAYIVKAIMKGLKIDFLQDNVLQSRITGWTTDYLVVCAFMAVSISVIGNWLMPILVVAAIITVITAAICFYFGQRIGGENDFERTLGLYGTATGTVPSGVSLIRIVDPDFHTTTSAELGLMNLVMMACTPVYFLILAYASGNLGLTFCLGGLAVCSLMYLIALKLTRCWGKKTFAWR